MKKKSLVMASIALIFFMSGCAGTQYLDANKAEGSSTWGPKEIKLTVKKMVGSLYLNLKNEWKKETLIQVRKIRNRTSEHIETRILSDQIVNNLLEKRIQFVDPSYTKEALEEMQKGMTGIVDSEYAIPVGELQSPNLYLYGEIHDNVRFVGGKRLQYLIVTIKLKSLRTGRLIWQGQKEFLKSTKTKNISW